MEGNKQHKSMKKLRRCFISTETQIKHDFTALNTKLPKSEKTK